MTSMNGVMLMSVIGALRPPRAAACRRRRMRLRPGSARCHRRAPQAASRSSIWRDRIAENSSAKPFEARLLLGHLGVELVVGDHRRDRREQADGGGEQRLRDAGRDRGERGVLRGRDRLERGHDAPHRAEQADERAGGADGGEDQELRFEPLDLALDGDVHHLLDAGLQAHEGPARRLERALPLAHGGDEQRRHAVVGARRRASGRAPPGSGRTRTPARSGPSRACVRAKRSVLSTMIAQHQIEAPSRPEHHELDDQMGLPEQAEQADIHWWPTSADCAISAEFMASRSFSRSRPARVAPAQAFRKSRAITRLATTCALLSLYSPPNVTAVRRVAARPRRPHPCSTMRKLMVNTRLRRADFGRLLAILRACRASASAVRRRRAGVRIAGSRQAPRHPMAVGARIAALSASGRRCGRPSLTAHDGDLGLDQHGPSTPDQALAQDHRAAPVEAVGRLDRDDVVHQRRPDETRSSCARTTKAMPVSRMEARWSMPSARMNSVRPALEEAQIARMVDEAGKVGVLVIDAQRQAMDAAIEPPLVGESV